MFLLEHGSRIPRCPPPLPAERDEYLWKRGAGPGVHVGRGALLSPPLGAPPARHLRVFSCPEVFQTLSFWGLLEASVHRQV